MDNALNLTQQSKLQQRLNPRQVMLGRFLEMSAPEIEEEVRRALDENPALEVVAEPETENIDEFGSFNETSEQLQQADFRDEDDIPSYRLEINNHSADDPHGDYFAISDHMSLIDVLSAQLPDLDLSADERRVAKYIIGNLDDNGYMTRSLSDIADDIAISDGEDVPKSVMKEVFAKIRHLDPAGIAAVDLRDCLLLQIDRSAKTLTSKIAREIVSDWFDLFSKKHFEQLRAHLGVDQEHFAEALEYIRRLNPKPGALIEGSISDDRMRHIVPDFTVEIDDNGVANVSLINTNPELSIEESFRVSDDIEPSNRRKADAMMFIKRRRDDAAMFIEMLKMRSQTLLTVMQAIVKLQHKFFETGNSSQIRPMIIRDIAELTGLNISVISRATASKYVLTPRGIYPLKMFFNERPTEASDTSSHQILSILSEIINGEDKSHPLSDDALCRILASKGIEIARRTVTKYRERLGLPVARLRKTF